MKMQTDRGCSLRSFRCSAFLVVSTLLGMGACGDQKNSSNNNSDDLDSILRDGDLTLLSTHALTVTAPATGGAAGGPVPTDAGTSSGGSIGSSDGSVGSGGSAGSAMDGGIGAGGKGGIGVDGGMGGGTGGLFPQEAQGLWQFDDCNPDRSDLFDSNFFGHTAFRSVSAGCVSGIQNQGIGIDQASDYVYVPDQPNFTFDNGVTAAAWVNPTTLGGVRTIFRKREGGTSTFVLLANGRDYQFVIRLANGRAAAVNARATLNTWTHVAGTYDGHDLRLYLNGMLAAHARVNGTLSSGAGPLLMGNDAFGRRLNGSLDNVFFDTNAATADQIVRLTCLPRPSTLVGVPAVGPTVPAGTEVSYDVQLTNNACDSQFFDFQAFSQTQGIFVQPSFDFRQIEPGATEHIALSVTSSPDIEPDDYQIPFSAFAFSNNFEFLSGSVVYSVQGTPCSVRTSKELMIKAVSVVDDPVRTAPGGAWTFGRLMENMAPTAAAAPAMVESMLQTWLSDQTVNGFSIPARPAMQDLVLSSFPRTPSGELDLSRAPVRLLAIVNRIDLRDLANGNAGEGRFVFGVLDQFGNQQQFTMIFEYKIPATTEQDVLDSANRWHALSALPFPSEEYNAALQALTDRFTGRDAAPGRINGSALGQFRTNEIALSFEWQFREFHLSPTTGLLQPETVALTPDLSFRNTTMLGDFINANETAILAQTHTVPLTFAGQPFLTGSVTNDLRGWDAPNVNNPEAREKFSLNTCNGCHSSRETNTGFLQVFPRNPGQEAFLSGFLTGTRVLDFGANVIRLFNDLGRRNRDLHVLICPTDPLPPAPPETTPVVVWRHPGNRWSRGRDGWFLWGGGMSGMGGDTGGGGATGTGGSRVPPPPLPPPALPLSTSAVGSTSGSLPTTVINESAAVTNRPDFIAKGIGRVH